MMKKVEILENNRKTASSNTRTPSLNLSTGWSTQVGDPLGAGSSASAALQSLDDEEEKANMELSSLNAELARRPYEMSGESLVGGTMQRLDVEDAQQSYFAANQQNLLSQYEYLSGLFSLRAALGLENLEELNTQRSK